MNASTRPSSFQGSALFAALTAIAIAGCSGAISPAPEGKTPPAGSQTAPLGAAPECAGKACGVDCSAAGSEEPFNCDATGHCVGAGADLACKKCPEFLGDCRLGEGPADFDGDGCIDGCKPNACPPFVGDCKNGDVPADLNGDGCIDGCKTP